MPYKTILLERRAGVAVVTLNRPGKKNAINPTMNREMIALLEALRYDDRVRVLVITGAGDAFSSGLDLKEMIVDLEDDPAGYDRMNRSVMEWRGRTLKYYPKPTIAMVNGYCFGGAFAIVEGCDLALAADDATFGLPEINFKVFPAGAVSKAIADLLRPRDALWYALLGRPFDGARAAEIGLVNQAVPRARLRQETMTIARELAAKDPHALKATKDAYRHSLAMPWDTAMNYALAKEMELVQRQGDAWRREGIGDFLAGKYRPGFGERPRQSAKKRARRR
ncbi:MAG: p-hydroxycinnamoyl CoA hydratase/lyase [Alphaproteobacteria bacterium]|nr:p-hydroxycinnamoyl CoA hydratase/lyase [Alphaproteobacteria bacterium]